MERLRQLNPVLPDIMISQLALLAAGELLIACLNTGRLAIGIGYAAGVIYSVVSAIHMASVMEKAMYYEEKGAVVRTVGGYLIRIAALFVIEFALYCVGGVISMFASLAAMFTMKVSAYFQPVTHKLLNKIKGKGGKQSGQSNDECSGA